MNISMYKSSTDTVGVEANYVKVLGGIKDGRWANEVENLRALLQNGRVDDYSHQKRNLPSATFSGTFAARKADAIKDYSSMIILDVDGLTAQQVESYKEAFRLDPIVHACFISPSGNGLKIIVKLSCGPKSHTKAFLALEKYFKETYVITLDKSGKDVSRLCYVSYDENLIYNSESEAFQFEEQQFEINTSNSFDKRPEKFKGHILSKDAKYALKVCEKWTEENHEYEPGNRNNYIYVLSCNLNRAGVHHDDALMLAYNKYSDLDFKEVEQVVGSAYKNRAEHNTIDIYNTDEPKVVQNANGEPLSEQEEILYADAVTFFQAGIKTQMVSKYLKAYGEQMDLNEKQIRDTLNQAFADLKNAKAADILTSATVESALMGILDGYSDTGRVSTLVKEIDDIMGGGFMPGSVYGLIGDGKTCKSVYAQCVGSEAAKNDQPVLYLNGEMSVYQLLDRVVDKELGIGLLNGIRDKKITAETLPEIMDKLKGVLKENFHMVSSAGWTRAMVLKTVQEIEAKTKKKVALIIADGLSQFDDTKKDEIKSAIFNSGELKEIAKEANAAVITLVHVSGGIGKHVRDTSKFVRGGQKICCNFDSMFCTSLFIDEESSNIDEGDILYQSGRFYLRFIDKRDSGAVLNKAIEVHRPMKLEPLSIDPQHMEAKSK